MKIEFNVGLRQFTMDEITEGDMLSIVYALRIRRDALCLALDKADDESAASIGFILDNTNKLIREIEQFGL